MNNFVIKAESLSKEYIINQAANYYSLRDYISEAPQRIVSRISKKVHQERFWALKNVSFELGKGEVLGVIGRNGAGKSTLLKILARIILPTQGHAIINGKIASMLEIGTGFHSELTGRENIFLNGAILGMKKKEINRKFNNIVEFSEIGKFIDMPVKKYSSGMYVRLAFSVAAHLDPEVVLLDEVLAVGDLPFQRKSLMKMHSIARDEGRTVIFVSHNLSSVDALCNKVILLEEGKVAAMGKTRDVISKYVTGLTPKSSGINKTIIRGGTGALKVKNFWVEDEKRKKTKMLKSGNKCYFIFEYETKNPICNKKIDVGFTVSNIVDQLLFSHYMSYSNQQLTRVGKNGFFVFEFEKFPLSQGEYKIGFNIKIDHEDADYMPPAIPLTVHDGDFYNTGSPFNQNPNPFNVSGKWVL